jgi:hypothetical protein
MIKARRSSTSGLIAAIICSAECAKGCRAAIPEICKVPEPPVVSVIGGPLDLSSGEPYLIGQVEKLISYKDIAALAVFTHHECIDCQVRGITEIPQYIEVLQRTVKVVHEKFPILLGHVAAYHINQNSQAIALEELQQSLNQFKGEGDGENFRNSSGVMPVLTLAR